MIVVLSVLAGLGWACAGGLAAWAWVHWHRVDPEAITHTILVRESRIESVRLLRQKTIPAEIVKPHGHGPGMVYRKRYTAVIYEA
jgi:hypothetical protein